MPDGKLPVQRCGKTALKNQHESNNTDTSNNNADYNNMKYDYTEDDAVLAQKSRKL